LNATELSPQESIRAGALWIFSGVRSSPLRRLRGPHKLAGASAGRERREVARVERMESRPIVPSPDHLAVVGIVPAMHGIAFLEGSAVSRMIICRSGCIRAADVMVLFPASGVMAQARLELLPPRVASADASRTAQTVEIGLLRAPPIGRGSRQSARGNQPKAKSRSGSVT
jgi:hypothetical protein